MPTNTQIKHVCSNLKMYAKRYLKAQYAELDEAATRLMINNFLTEVLGYTELEDIKTEYNINGDYADYVIQLKRKNYFVVEVKAIQLDLNDRHLRQSVAYATNEGIDWIILTNGRQFDLYRVLFDKPITTHKVFSCDITKNDQVQRNASLLVYLTKKCALNGELEKFWIRSRALDPKNLCLNLYSDKVVRILKRFLRKKTGLSLCEEDILNSIHQIITTKIESDMPKHPIKTRG